MYLGTWVDRRYPDQLLQTWLSVGSETLLSFSSPHPSLVNGPTPAPLVSGFCCSEKIVGSHLVLEPPHVGPVFGKTRVLQCFVDDGPRQQTPRDHKTSLS